MTAKGYDDPVARARGAVDVHGLEVVDLAVGAFGVVLPAVDAAVFFRLAPAVGGPIDRARSLYLLLAAMHLRAGTGGWIDGPGVAGGCRAGGDGASDVLRAEIETVAPAIRALGEDERFARAYLDLHVGVATAVDDTTSRAGARPDPSVAPTHATPTKRRV